MSTADVQFNGRKEGELKTGITWTEKITYKGTFVKTVLSVAGNAIELKVVFILMRKCC